MPFPPVLPPELIGWVARCADPADLPLLALVSRTFRAESTRVLYGTVRISTPAALIAFNRTISEQESLAHLVVALNFATPSDAWHDTAWPKLVHLRHLHLYAHSMLDHLALIPNDLLSSFRLRSEHQDGVGETDAMAVVSFLRHQRRLEQLFLDPRPKELNAWSQRLGTQDLPALTSFATCFPDLLVLVSGCALHHVAIAPSIKDSSRIQFFLSLCPRSVKSLGITIPFEKQLSVLFVISTSLPELVSLNVAMLSLRSQQDLRALIEAVAHAEDLPSFRHLRTFEIYSSGVSEANFGDFFALCRAAFTHFQTKAAPQLQRLTVRWKHGPMCTVDNASHLAPQQYRVDA